MDYLIDLGVFWSRYGSVILTTLFGAIVMWLMTRGASKKALFLQAVVDDLTASNQRSRSLLAESEARTKLADDAWLAASNENLKLKRENHLLRDKISKKQEFRLRNGLWCTEEQYLAEKNGTTVKEQLDEMANKTHDAIAAVDINEECNKQIEEFLKK